MNSVQGPEEAPTEDTFDLSSKHAKVADNEGAKSAHVNVEQLEITGIDYLHKLVFGQLLELKLHRIFYFFFYFNVEFALF